MARSQEEFKLSCVVADYLARALPKRIPWSHFPAGENRSAITGARLKRMGTQKGWADYLILAEGLPIALELKTPKGKVSDEQGAFGDAWTANGGKYAVCRSLDEVQAVLESAGVPLLARVA
jgi:hypothetical protein